MDKLSIRLAAGSGRTFGVDDIACAAATYFGSWEEEGLQVTWTPVHGGVAAVKAVLDGSVDVSYGGLGPVLRFRSEGHPLLVLVSMARGLAQNLVVQERIKDVTQLRGASWALDGFGALSHHMAQLIVRALKIRNEEIKWEAVGPPPERIARLLDRSVDASLIRVEEALALSLNQVNGLRILLGFQQLKELVPVQPHGVLATQESYAEQHPEELRRLARGMIRASRALHNSFEIFEKVYQHYVTVSIPPEQVQSIWRDEKNSGGFALNGELTPGHWEAQMNLFYELHPHLPRVTRREVIAENFVAGALNELGIVPGPDAPVDLAATGAIREP